MKDLKIFTKNIEQEAINQIDNLLNQEVFKDCKVRIMPDVHAGAGCVIGFTANLGDKVIPNVVGVDIGCGMSWAKLGKVNIDLKILDDFIKREIPSGMNVRDDIIESFVNLKELSCYNELKNKNQWLEKSMGTLGGGNHFIEVAKDEDGNLYLIIHTGSRNLGKQVCDIYQNKAIKNYSFDNEIKLERQKVIEELKASDNKHLIQEALKNIDKKYKGKTKLPKDLCYLDGEERNNYLHDMKLCQKWARDNRKTMIRQICLYLGIYKVDYFETIHNYIAEDNIVRKGAISARKGEKVLIPINMRDGCILGVGKGNEDWNFSAPHGAGRIMSRTKARELLSLQEFEVQMQGVYTTTATKETIDEAPMAYKNIKDIIDNIKDTVEIIEIIKPIYNFKASE